MKTLFWLVRGVLLVLLVVSVLSMHDAYRASDEMFLLWATGMAICVTLLERLAVAKYRFDRGER